MNHVEIRHTYILIIANTIEQLKELLKQRVNAFKEGSLKLGEEGKLLKISMQRMAYAAINESDAKEKNIEIN